MTTTHCSFLLVTQLRPGVYLRPGISLGCELSFVCCRQVKHPKEDLLSSLETLGSANSDLGVRKLSQLSTGNSVRMLS